ncbi:hypothetical protein EHH54_38740, partial [Rhizobium leguminosarum]
MTIGMNFLPFLIRQNPASGGRMTIFSILGDLAGALVHSHSDRSLDLGPVCNPLSLIPCHSLVKKERSAASVSIA